MLQSSHPEWKFGKSNTWGEPKKMKISLDVGGVASTADDTMSKLRGSIVKNASVTDAQRAQGMAVFDGVGALIKLAYEFETLQASADEAGAASYLKETSARN